jgi:hypothetical protein
MSRLREGPAICRPADSGSGSGRKWVSLMRRAAKNIRGVKFSLLLLLLAVCAVSTGAQVTTNADGTVRSGQWKYQLMLLNQGTPEQESVGKLSFMDKEVIGGPYHRISTPLGEFMWAPYTCERSRCGWYRINPKKKYSRWVRVKINESEEGPVLHTVEGKPR